MRMPYRGGRAPLPGFVRRYSRAANLHEVAHAPRQEVALPKLLSGRPGRRGCVLDPARRREGLLRWRRCALLLCLCCARKAPHAA